MDPRCAACRERVSLLAGPYPLARYIPRRRRRRTGIKILFCFSLTRHGRSDLFYFHARSGALRFGAGCYGTPFKQKNSISHVEIKHFVLTENLKSFSFDEHGQRRLRRRGDRLRHGGVTQVDGQPLRRVLKVPTRQCQRTAFQTGFRAY
jgi:hypothetical protein